MNKINILFIPCLILISSCSALQAMKYKTGHEALKSSQEVFRFEDKGTNYRLKKNEVYTPEKKSFSTKRVLEIPSGYKAKIVEQSIAISQAAEISKTKLPVLVPQISQFNVWFDGKKYVSELKILPKERSIQIKMNSPESQWNGVETHKLPEGKVLPCFFSQIIECAKVSGFIKESSLKERGSMQINILWEGYPFLSEIYSEFPREFLTPAILEYDGLLSKNERRFNLNLSNQSIVFILNNKDEVMKMLWVSQGITMLHNSVKETDSNQER